MELREELIGEMVGNLYPQIVAEEIQKLRIRYMGKIK
jgi:hypothetical protein